MNISIHQGKLFNKLQKKNKQNTIGKSKRKLKSNSLIEGFTSNQD